MKKYACALKHNFYPSAGIIRIRLMGVISARYIKAPLRLRAKVMDSF